MQIFASVMIHKTYKHRQDWRFFSFEQASNLIYVDQPTGTGFSYTTDNKDIRHDENGVSNDLYDFLQVNFFIMRVSPFWALLVHDLLICKLKLNFHLYLKFLGFLQRASAVCQKWLLHNWRILCWALHPCFCCSCSPRKQKQRRNSDKPQGACPLSYKLNLVLIIPNWLVID